MSLVLDEAPPAPVALDWPRRRTEAPASTPLSDAELRELAHRFDDAPAEERRTQAIRSRHLLDPEEAANLGRLDPEAIRRVCAEAWPEARTADELQDALCLTGFITEAEAGAKGLDWMPLLAGLMTERRATVVIHDARRLWVSAERLAQVLQLVHLFLELCLAGAIELGSAVVGGMSVVSVSVVNRRGARVGLNHRSWV